MNTLAYLAVIFAISKKLKLCLGIKKSLKQNPMASMGQKDILTGSNPNGDPKESRTPLAGMKTQCPNH